MPPRYALEMGIAGGVLLILAGIINLVGSFFYIVGVEFFVSVRSAFGSPSALTIDPAIVTGYGVFLLAVAGLEIGAGVLLIMGRSRAFVMAITLLGIAAEIGSMLVRSELAGAGVNMLSWTQFFGIGAAVFAMIAAVVVKPPPPRVEPGVMPYGPYPGYYPAAPGYGTAPGGYGPPPPAGDPPPYGPGGGPRFG